jgi:hypothetical protein
VSDALIAYQKSQEFREQLQLLAGLRRGCIAALGATLQGWRNQLPGSSDQ